MFFTLLLACSGSVSQEDWSARYAKAACKAYESCTRLYFTEYFSDFDDCVDTFQDNLDYDDAYDDCDFDIDHAEECLDALKSYADTCEYRDIDDECEGVWACDDRRRDDTGRDSGRFRDAAGCTNPLASWGGLSLTFFFFAPWMRRRRSP